MIFVSSSSPAQIRAELLLSQKRLMSNGLNSKESLDKGEAVERILAAGNSSRSGFQMFCHGHVDLLGQVLMCAIIAVCHSQCQSVKHVSHITQELYELPAHLALLHADLRRNLLFYKYVTCNVVLCSTSCTVCCDDYESGDALRVLKCGHKYHVECIDKWLLSSTDYLRAPACPICSAALSTEEH